MDSEDSELELKLNSFRPPGRGALGHAPTGWNKMIHQ